jgi:hypothetical protein
MENYSVMEKIVQPGGSRMLETFPMWKVVRENSLKGWYLKYGRNIGKRATKRETLLGLRRQGAGMADMFMDTCEVKAD